jgi:hypothetical protein
MSRLRLLVLLALMVLAASFTPAQEERRWLAGDSHIHSHPICCSSTAWS